MFPYPNLGDIVHEYIYDDGPDLNYCGLSLCGLAVTLHDINETGTPYSNPVWFATPLLNGTGGFYDACTGVGSPKIWTFLQCFGRVASI